MANLAALRAAVFSLSAKNLRGVDIRPPAVRGLNKIKQNNKSWGLLGALGKFSEAFVDERRP